MLLWEVLIILSHLTFWERWNWGPTYLYHYYDLFISFLDLFVISFVGNPFYMYLCTIMLYFSEYIYNIWEKLQKIIYICFYQIKNKKWKSLSLSNSLRPNGLYSPWNSPGQTTGVDSLFLLQGIFPTQGLNPGLRHCRWIPYQLSHKGSPLSDWSFIKMTHWKGKSLVKEKIDHQYNKLILFSFCQLV